MFANPIRLLVLTLLVACASAQNVQLSEFLTVNTAGIQDEDGSYQGWIEIWNPQQSSTTGTLGVVTLTDYKLSDGIAPVPWSFPNVQIMPDERIFVWASGKNRRSSTAPLHTNFTLSPSGGVLRLLNASNAVISEITYPAQTANVSYGQDEWVPAQKGSYSEPTPGDRNSFSGPGVAGRVNFSASSRAFTAASPVSLTLTQEDPDPSAVIRYTLNGTVPVATSPPYSAPINITATTVVRARVFHAGLLPGETETHGFLLLDGSTQNFSSPMPIMVVSNFGQGTPPEHGDQVGFAWMWEPTAPTNRSRFTDLPTFASRMSMDRRGSSTLGNPKHNVNFEVRNPAHDDDRDVSFLGMAQGSDYVLHAPYNFDRSLVHNPFIYGLSRSIGRWAPDARMIEVFFEVNGGALSGTTSGDYFGIYNFMEKVRRDGDRVDITNLRTYDNDSVKVTGGYIYKVDRLDAGDGGFSAGGQSMAYYEPKEVEIKSPQRSTQRTYLSLTISQFNTVLQSGSWNNPTTGYAARIDVPAAIDHHLLNTWSMNVDALRLSGYWHKDRGGKLVPGPIWDFDRAMESTDGRDDNPSTWRGTGDATDFFNYTWWNRMFFDIDFYQKYIDRWFELRTGQFSQASVNSMLDAWNAQMPAESILRDLQRWGQSKRGGTFPGSPTSYPATQAGEIQRIKDWLQVRATFFESQWVGKVTTPNAEGNVAPGTQVTLSGPPGATIYYTINGADPRPSGGGAPGGGATQYTGPIVVNSTSRIRARAYNPAWTAQTGSNNPFHVSRWGPPLNVRYSTDLPAPADSLIITEVNYHPADISTAEQVSNPAYPDTGFEFIEIKNVGSVPVDMGGVTFTKGIDFTFSGPNALTLAPGEFAVVAANPSAFTARYGGAIPNVVGPFTAGELANGGEALELRTAANDIAHAFTYNDAWYATTDGGGRTLAVYNPLAQESAFNNASNWRASAAVNGSPGADEPNLAPTLTPGSTIAAFMPMVLLNANVTDDSQPANTVTVAWSKETGPGSAAFDPADETTTTATLGAPGVYVLRLTASDTALASHSDFTIHMRDTPGEWILRNPGIGTLTDDPDGDGRTNIFEWALSLPPMDGAGGDGTVVAVEDDHLTLTYTRQKSSPFVGYTVQVTSDVSAWTDPQPGDITETILSDDGVLQTVKARDNTAMSAQPERFIRLKVTPN